MSRYVGMQITGGQVIDDDSTLTPSLRRGVAGTEERIARMKIERKLEREMRREKSRRRKRRQENLALRKSRARSKSRSRRSRTKVAHGSPHPSHRGNESRHSRRGRYQSERGSEQKSKAFWEGREIKLCESRGASRGRSRSRSRHNLERAASFDTRGRNRRKSVSRSQSEKREDPPNGQWEDREISAVQQSITDPELNHGLENSPVLPDKVRSDDDQSVTSESCENSSEASDGRDEEPEERQDQSALEICRTKSMRSGSQRKVKSRLKGRGRPEPSTMMDSKFRSEGGCNQSENDEKRQDTTSVPSSTSADLSRRERSRVSMSSGNKKASRRDEDKHVRANSRPYDSSVNDQSRDTPSREVSHDDTPSGACNTRDESQMHSGHRGSNPMAPSKGQSQESRRTKKVDRSPISPWDWFSHIADSLNDMLDPPPGTKYKMRKQKDVWLDDQLIDEAHNLGKKKIGKSPRSKQKRHGKELDNTQVHRLADPKSFENEKFNASESMTLTSNIDKLVLNSDHSDMFKSASREILRQNSHPLATKEDLLPVGLKRSLTGISQQKNHKSHSGHERCERGLRADQMSIGQSDRFTPNLKPSYGFMQDKRIQNLQIQAANTSSALLCNNEQVKSENPGYAGITNSTSWKGPEDEKNSKKGEKRALDPPAEYKIHDSQLVTAKLRDLLSTRSNSKSKEESLTGLNDSDKKGATIQEQLVPSPKCAVTLNDPNFRKLEEATSEASLARRTLLPSFGALKKYGAKRAGKVSCIGTRNLNANRSDEHHQDTPTTEKEAVSRGDPQTSIGETAPDNSSFTDVTRDLTRLKELLEKDLQTSSQDQESRALYVEDQLMGALKLTKEESHSGKAKLEKSTVKPLPDSKTAELNLFEKILRKVQWSKEPFLDDYFIDKAMDHVRSDRLLAAIRDLHNVVDKDRVAANDSFRDLLMRQRHFDRVLADLLPRIEEASGQEWTRCELAGLKESDTEMHFRQDDDCQFTYRLECPIEESLLVSLVAVLLESQFYDRWLPRLTFPDLGLKKAKRKMKPGSMRQEVELELKVPWPIKQKRGLVSFIGADDIDENNAILIAFASEQKEEVVVESQFANCLGDTNMDFEGGFLIQAYPEGPFYTAKSSDEPMFLVGLTIAINVSLPQVPTSVLSEITQRVVFDLWTLLIAEAKQLLLGKRAHYIREMAGDRKDTYRWFARRCSDLFEKVHENTEEKKDSEALSGMVGEKTKDEPDDPKPLRQVKKAQSDDKRNKGEGIPHVPGETPHKDGCRIVSKTTIDSARKANMNGSTASEENSQDELIDDSECKRAQELLVRLRSTRGTLKNEPQAATMKQESSKSNSRAQRSTGTSTMNPFSLFSVKSFSGPGSDSSTKKTKLKPDQGRAKPGLEEGSKRGSVKTQWVSPELRRVKSQIGTTGYSSGLSTTHWVRETETVDEGFTQPMRRVKSHLSGERNKYSSHAETAARQRSHQVQEKSTPRKGIFSGWKSRDPPTVNGNDDPSVTGDSVKSNSSSRRGFFRRFVKKGSDPPDQEGNTGNYRATRPPRAPRRPRVTGDNDDGNSSKRSIGSRRSANSVRGYDSHGSERGYDPPEDYSVCTGYSGISTAVSCHNDNDCRESIEISHVEGQPGDGYGSSVQHDDDDIDQVGRKENEFVGKLLQRSAALTRDKDSKEEFVIETVESQDADEHIVGMIV